MARPNGLSQQYRFGEDHDTERSATRNLVAGVSYAIAGELEAIKVDRIAETREYDHAYS